MGSKNKVDIQYGSLFPWPFQLIAGIVVIVAASLILERTAVALAFIIVSGFVLTAAEGTEIDLSRKTFLEYKSFYLIKSGTKESFSGMDKIFINTSKSRQQMYTAHTTKSSIYENIEYNAFLKFDDGTKVHLLKKRKKDDLMKRISTIAAKLGVPVEDHTIAVG